MKIELAPSLSGAPAAPKEAQLSIMGTAEGATRKFPQGRTYEKGAFFVGEGEGDENFQKFLLLTDDFCFLP